VDVPNYFFESLGYMVPDRNMDPYFAEFLPVTRDMEPKAHMHPGFEFLYVLDGELSLRHGEQDCTLEPGDAVYFDSGTPHSYQCAGKKPVGAIIVTMHQAAAAGAPPRLVNATVAVKTVGPAKVGQ
jgi:mannose-6-phosphate isomerase-like protein (cupin superfamily)